MRQQRNISSVGEGFAEGGEALRKGFYSGVTGLVSKPFEGARETGIGGTQIDFQLHPSFSTFLPHIFSLLALFKIGWFISRSLGSNERGRGR